MLKRIVVLAAAISLVALPISSASAAPSKNIVETAAGAPQFSTLVSLVEKAGLVGVLSGRPTTPKKTLNELASDKAMLKEVLLYTCCPARSRPARC
jgi:uncharacterized surface protein with fasciclin (FAS1) repeats